MDSCNWESCISFYRMKKVTQDKSQEKNYSKHVNDIEANIKKLMCRESDSKGGVIEFSEKVEAIDSPQIHQLLAVLLISLGINNTGAEEIWNVLLETLKSRLPFEAFGSKKALGKLTIDQRNSLKMFGAIAFHVRTAEPWQGMKCRPREEEN